MNVWRVGAKTSAGGALTALVLLVVSRWVGFRFGGFDALYSAATTDVLWIAFFGLLSLVLFVIGEVVAIRTSMSPLPAPIRETPGEESETRTVDPAERREVESPAPVLGSGSVARGPSEGDPPVHISSLSRLYRLGPVEVHARRDVTLDFPAGSLTVVLGPSGSGKTTLLNLLGGIDRATSGRIRMDGLDVTELDEARLVSYRREKVGFVFQFFNLIPSLTARENVALAAELVPHAADVEEVLRMVGLGERMDHFPAELSGGEQQRVAIARALVKNPPLLLCDEPTGELDYTTGIKILEILKGVAHGDGRAVIVVTHNAIIAEMADQVVRLRGGRIDQIVRNPEPVPPAMLRW